MSHIINLDKTIPSSKIQPEIFRIKRKLKSAHIPDYIAVIKGTDIEMVCINKAAWEEYLCYKITGTKNQKKIAPKEFSDKQISDGFSSLSAADFLKKEPKMTDEEYKYYMSL